MLIWYICDTADDNPLRKYFVCVAVSKDRESDEKVAHPIVW